MKKFKVGDRVQMTREQLDWRCGWTQEGYEGPAGQWHFSVDQYRDLAVLYLSQKFNCPLRGTITGSNKAQCPDDFAWQVEFKNKFGNYGMSLFADKDLIKLKKVYRCKECNRAKSNRTPQ